MTETLVTTHYSDLHENPLVQLKEVSHVGIVVDDMDEAIRFYSETFGIGPFQIVDFDGANTDFFYSYGKTAKPKMKAGLYYSGTFFIELVEVTEGETVHTQFFSERGAGMQHLCFMVEGMDEVLNKLKTKGIEAVLDYQFSAGEGDKAFTIREVYLNTDKFTGGTTIQLLERTTG
jgi:catechol 2,3-dioxygenase-like lactoylglutathione lyase family enzyme